MERTNTECWTGWMGGSMVREFGFGCETACGVFDDV